MKEVNNEVEMIRTKVDYYYKSAIPVHIVYKKGFWKNGYVKEISSDFFILNEFLEGDLIIFFIEIDKIENYKEKKDG